MWSRKTRKDKKLILFHLNGSRLVEQSLPWFIFSLSFIILPSWVEFSLPFRHLREFISLFTWRTEHHLKSLLNEEKISNYSFTFLLPLAALQSYFINRGSVGEASINFIHFLLSQGQISWWNAINGIFEKKIRTELNFFNFKANLFQDLSKQKLGGRW